MSDRGLWTEVNFDEWPITKPIFRSKLGSKLLVEIFSLLCGSVGFRALSSSMYEAAVSIDYPSLARMMLRAWEISMCIINRTIYVNMPLVIVSVSGANRYNSSASGEFTRKHFSLFLYLWGKAEIRHTSRTIVNRCPYCAKSSYISTCLVFHI